MAFRATATEGQALARSDSGGSAHQVVTGTGENPDDAYLLGDPVPLGMSNVFYYQASLNGGGPSLFR